MNRDILDNNLLKSILDLGLRRRFMFQQDNDPNHTAKITKDFQWPSQSADVNSISYLWRD